MTESVQVALIVGGFSFGGSVALAIIAGWLAGRKARQDAQIRSDEKAEDYKRQDDVIDRANAVAEQAASAATLLLESNAEVAGAAIAAEARQTHKLDRLEEGQKQIHTLVNSNMTAAMQDSHDSAVLLLAALQENVEGRAARGEKPNPATAVAIKLAETKIAELDATLADRRTAQGVVNHQQAAAAGQT